MSDFKVEIERNVGRRMEILSHLIEHRLPGLINVKQENIDNVSDAEVEWFISSMTQEENNWARRRYKDIFHKNVTEAMSRLHPPKSMTVGRAATGIIDFEHNEASSSTTPIDPNRQ
jgi:hypothetical protein